MTTTEDSKSELEPCRCPAQPDRHATAVVHDPAVCLLVRANHQVTVIPRIDCGPGNWLATCTCGKQASMAGPATLEAAIASATEAASGGGFDHAWQLENEINGDAAREDLDWIATRADACRWLADQACWTEAPDPDEPQRVRYAYKDALAELEAPDPDEPPAITRRHLEHALAIALGEVHPPAADPEYHADVILLELPIQWRGEGSGPAPAEVVAEIVSRLPRWLQRLDDDDPAAWALGEPRLPEDKPLMVDLTRPARWHAPGTPNGREDGWMEHEHTLRVEFGDHFEPGWYTADHGPEVPAYRGPFETAQAAIVGVPMGPTVTLQWLGAHPDPATS